MALPVVVGGALGLLGGLIGAAEQRAAEEADRRHKMALLMAAPGLHAPNAWNIQMGSRVSPLGSALGGLGLGAQQGMKVGQWLNSPSGGGSNSPTNWQALSSMFSRSPGGP